MREVEHACRGCGATGLQQFLDLGEMPLVDRLPAPDDNCEPRYPLRVALCEQCALVQLLESPAPRVLFPEDYPYYSSSSPAWVAHAQTFAGKYAAWLTAREDALVVEIASNDGYLLQHFAATGIRVLGVDPADGPAAAAQTRGIPTRTSFFTLGMATAMVAEGMRADLIVGNNVLAHVPDPNDLLAAMALLLAADGIISIEVPYVRALIEGNQFDTIYHEHHSYFSVLALERLFTANGLQLVDVERLATHGGSLRLTVAHAATVRPASKEVTRLLAEEVADGIPSLDYYRDFAARVEETCTTLHRLLAALRADGNRIAAYGAAAKGAVLANRAGIDVDLCAFVVDRNEHKHGRRLPGTRIPIRPVDALLAEMPDVVVILCWNWADEVIAQQAEYLRRGGKFLIPIPSPRLVSWQGTT